MPKPISEEEFDRRLAEWHAGNLRRVSPFLGMHGPLTVECARCNSTVQHRRAQNVRKSRGAVGCMTCRAGYLSKVKAWTHERYCKELASAHPGLELLTPYLGSMEPVTYRCSAGHETATHAAAYLLYAGCGECKWQTGLAKRRAEWLMDHKALLWDKFGDRIRFVEGFSDPKQGAVYACSLHGQFEAAPAVVEIAKYACRICAAALKPETKRSNAVARTLPLIRKRHGGAVTVLQHRGVKDQARFRCGAGHEWETTLDSVARGSGCRYCSFERPYSQESIRWLQRIEVEWGISIAHAESGGEVRVSGASGRIYSVDGFCTETNTVFEFYGDAYHGNPAKYAPDVECCAWQRPGVTAAQLHAETMKREADIVAAGHPIVVVWQADFRGGRLVSYIRGADFPPDAKDRRKRVEPGQHTTTSMGSPSNPPGTPLDQPRAG